MADIYDKATDVEMLEREHALAAQAAIAASTPRPTPMGHCLNPLCSEPFGPDESQRLFCGRECADEYARVTRK
ncbi:hypothetical protein [Microvirga sp. 17 mud 1-3]|uniref:hypothetical protein n=1 Tax=Microvirga sp. 17 mud 1-3 TaxID=2082949 RepID=UPI000D6C2978|nr:hypothetical protein [Microvirga sp. 17 mud 1-3]AWM87338.1 hypothetical protein C4E04_11740 [Microvirga sp. 17 mud 1-3]